MKSDDNNNNNIGTSQRVEESCHSLSTQNFGDVIQGVASYAPTTDTSKKTHGEENPEYFLSCIEPLIKKFEENLRHEDAYMQMLQRLCTSLQDENKYLKCEIDALKDFILAAKFDQSMSEKREISLLQSKVFTLEAALRLEMLKSEEYRNEADDARKALVRRTRSSVGKGQIFEVVIAQRPQEVAMAAAVACSLQDQNVGSCPICLEDFDTASGWYSLNCGHKYHLVCLAKVMPTRARCCVCNKDIHKLLYEIFGMANRYPDDARLWDAQTGHPVDFTLEEDIRVIVEEVNESQEAEDDNEDNEEAAADDEQEAGMSHDEEEEESENDGLGDREENEDDEAEAFAEPEGEEEIEETEYSFRLSSDDDNEQDDPHDPDYEPSHGDADDDTDYHDSHDDRHDPDYFPTRL